MNMDGCRFRNMDVDRRRWRISSLHPSVELNYILCNKELSFNAIPRGANVFHKAKSFDRSELDSRFVKSQPLIGSSAVSRFLIGCKFQTNVVHGNRDTGNNILINKKLSPNLLVFSYKYIMTAILRFIPGVRIWLIQTLRKEKADNTNGHSKWWYSAVAWRLFVTKCG